MLVSGTAGYKDNSDTPCYFNQPCCLWPWKVATEMKWAVCWDSRYLVEWQL